MESSQRRQLHGRLRLPVGVAAALLVVTTTVHTEDWPQWRGADRRGVWTETGILDRFPDDGLEVSWRVPIHSGFAGPAVADGRVFVLDYLETPGSRTMDGAERLVCLDEETGETLWTYEWPTTYRMLMATYATGPRATPTVERRPITATSSHRRSSVVWCTIRPRRPHAGQTLLWIWTGSHQQSAGTP